MDGSGWPDPAGQGGWSADDEADDAADDARGRRPVHRTSLPQGPAIDFAHRLMDAFDGSLQRRSK
jgi:hypothetical protein